MFTYKKPIIFFAALIITFIVFFAWQRCTKKQEPTDSIPTIQVQDFIKLTKLSEVVVIACFKQGCPFCKKTKPKLDAVSKHYKKEDRVCIRQLYKHQLSEEIKSQYKVTQYPTILIFKDGKLVEHIADSSQPTTTYQQAIDKLLAAS